MAEPSLAHHLLPGWGYGIRAPITCTPSDSNLVASHERMVLIATSVFVTSKAEAQIDARLGQFGGTPPLARLVVG